MKTIFIVSLFIMSAQFNAGVCHASVTLINIAPTGRITGKVYDSSTKLPIPNVSVVLYSMKDSSLVAGTITNNDGSFCITATDPGSCYLVFSYLGYEPISMSLPISEAFSRNVQLGEIKLDRSEQNLANQSKRR